MIAHGLWCVSNKFKRSERLTFLLIV